MTSHFPEVDTPTTLHTTTSTTDQDTVLTTTQEHVTSPREHIKHIIPVPNIDDSKLDDLTHPEIYFSKLQSLCEYEVYETSTLSHSALYAN